MDKGNSPAAPSERKIFVRYYCYLSEKLWRVMQCGNLWNESLQVSILNSSIVSISQRKGYLYE